MNVLALKPSCLLQCPADLGATLWDSNLLPPALFLLRADCSCSTQGLWAVRWEERQEGSWAAALVVLCEDPPGEPTETP